MKGTEQFKAVIKEYLDRRASEDELFAQRYRSTTRTIDDVCTYIINQVKASGMCGFTDDEVFSMAVHVIDEPDIEIGQPIQCSVVVNRQVKLTEEEIQQAKEQAREKVMREEAEKLRKASAPKKTEPKKPQSQAQTLSLFDFDNEATEQ